jgi:hypothetical protein
MELELADLCTHIYVHGINSYKAIIKVPTSTSYHNHMQQPCILALFLKAEGGDGLKLKTLLGTVMLQARSLPVRIPDEVDFFNLPNPSSCTMTLGSTQPLNRNEYQESSWG